MTTTETGKGLRVIGAGWGRTGTASLKRALEQLGFGPCHHMEEVFQHPAEVPTWERAARGEKIDWVTFMAPWGAAVDFPAALYYRELMAAFPEAKVILTVRDAESWYASMRETIYPAIMRWPNRWIIPFLPRASSPGRVTQGSFLRREVIERFEDRAHVMKMFDDYNAEVPRIVPAERLLVFHPKEGWAPLCAFLGVPVPDVPFPRVNDTAEFRRRVTAMTVISWVLLLLPFALAASIARWLLH